MKNKNWIKLRSGKLFSRSFILKPSLIFREFSEEELQGTYFPEIFDNCAKEMSDLGTHIENIKPLANNLRQSLFFPRQTLFNRETMERFQTIGQNITNCAKIIEDIVDVYKKIWNEGLLEINEINNRFLEKKRKRNL